MPPMFISIGAHVGTRTLVDSHALVGSCAQVGERVHVSAGARIGGVLEPIGAMPVIIEDDVLVGGSTGVYEGTRGEVARGHRGRHRPHGATPVYDLPRRRVIRPGDGVPVVIPEGAVVVPGARAVTAEAGREWGLALAMPVIVKYRDERTDAGAELEAWLR